MVLILVGNAEQFTHACVKLIFFGKNPISDCFWSNQMPQTDHITDIAPYVHTYSTKRADNYGELTSVQCTVYVYFMSKKSHFI